MLHVSSLPGYPKSYVSSVIMGIDLQNSSKSQGSAFQRISLLFSLIFLAYVFGYVIYQRFLHPLAGYPGPFLASLTDLWQVRQFLTLKQPYHLTELHEKYGPFVRYGPDKLSITAEEAIAPIYQKGGRSMPKTEFYDAYGAAHPNVFGMRDEAVSSLALDKIIGNSLTSSDRLIPSADVTCRTASQSATSKTWNSTWT